MELERVKIESVFEESTCTTCGRFGVDKYSSIVDTYIKYKNKFISFVEIIRTTLDYEPTSEKCSMEICDICKNKLVEFYIFKMRSMEARKIQQECVSEEKLLTHENFNPIVFSTLKIIQDFIKTNSVKCIEIDENSSKLLVISSSPEENVIEEQLEVIEEETINSKYLDEFLVDNEESVDEISVNCDESIDSESNSKSEKSTNLRRPRHEDEWACNKRKRLRNSGKSYVNSKGRLVKGKKMLPSCGSGCRSRCESRISENDRLMNFENFWNLGDVVEQRKFINNHIVSKEPVRRKSEQSNRNMTLKFHLDTCDKDDNLNAVQVCKKMFKNTLVVSNQVIQGVVTKYVRTGFLDPRGKHKRMPTESQILAREHVQRFPFFYVEQTMTKVQLYNLYVNECKMKEIEPVKESNYRDIFDKFNSNSFLKTERILCEKCHQYYKATDEERLALQKEHNEHIAVDKKCRDRALGRIRHKKSIERRKAEKLAQSNDSQ